MPNEYAVTPSDRAAITVLASLLHGASDQRAVQLEKIQSRLPTAWAAVLDEHINSPAFNHTSSRFNTFRDQLDKLTQLQDEQKALLLDLVVRLIRADRRISLTEHLYLRMLRDTLQPAPQINAARPRELRAACNLLLSLTARAGQHSESTRVAAFRAGAAASPMDGLHGLLPASELSAAKLDNALDVLAATNEGFRSALYRALGRVAMHDGRVNPAERELLAAAGLALRIDQSLMEAAPDEAKNGAAPSDALEHMAPLTQTDGTAAADDTIRHDRSPARALIVANLLPLLGVAFLDWDVRYLLLLYWLENLVIGACTLIRMFSVGGIRALGTSVFFTIHYGFFCAGHGMFVLALSSLGDMGSNDALDFDEGDIPALIPLYLLIGVFRWIATHMPDLLFVPLLALIVSHGISLAQHHFMAGEDRGRTVDSIMFDPYPRMAILHVAIIAGAFFVITSNGGSVAPVLIILIAAKTWLDLRLHQRAHTKRMQARQAAVAEDSTD